MGKKFTKAIAGVALIVVGYFTGGATTNWGLKLLASAFISAGINTVLSVAVSAFAKTPRTNPNPINLTIRGTVEYRRIVFGRRRCGGVLVFYGVSGSENQYLWYVIAYAGHQCSAFGDFWMDERRLDASTIPGGGGGQVSGFNGKIHIWKHLGTSAQTVDTNLDSAFGAWTTDHRLRGICYAAIRIERDDEIFEYGAPNSWSALIDGALTYDARLDSTNGGSGSHRTDNATTWAFSRDPVQHIRWYLTGGSVVNDVATPQRMYGLRELDSRVDDAYTIAASNICDQTLTGANQPPSGDQPRYRCDLEANCSETRREILAALVASMAGTVTYVHGKWRIYAGAFDTPLHTVTQDDLYGDLEVQDTVGHEARYNAVAPVFIDSANQHIQTTGNYRTDSAYETQDNDERITTELTLDAVTDQYQAQRLAEIHLRKSRMMRSVKFIGALDMLRIAPHEGVYYSDDGFEWTNRVFRSKERQIEFDEEAGRVTHVAQRDDAGVWADLLTADYETGTSNTDVFQTDGPATPLGLTATSRTFSIEFLITPPAYFRSGSVYELWEHTSSTPFSSATKLADISGTRYTLFRPDTITRYYWIRVRDPSGALSGTFPSSTGLAGVAAPFMWTLQARGNSVLTGPDSFAKVGGSAAWDSDVHTSQGFRGGAVANWRDPGATSLNWLGGLNSDPLTDQSFTSIDYAFHGRGGGAPEIVIYESGTQVAGPWTRTSGDRFTVRYDGYYVRYYQNQTLRREVAAGSGLAFFFDMSLNDPGVALDNFSFGPVGQVSDLTTVQLSIDAATSTTTAYVASHTAVNNFGADTTWLTITTVAQSVNHTIQVTASMDAWKAVGTAQRTVELFAVPSPGGPPFYGSAVRDITFTAAPGERIALQADFPALANTQYIVRVALASPGGGLGNTEVRDATLRVEHIKR